MAGPCAGLLWTRVMQICISLDKVFPILFADFVPSPNRLRASIALRSRAIISTIFVESRDPVVIMGGLLDNWVLKLVISSKMQLNITSAALKALETVSKLLEGWPRMLSYYSKL